MSRASFTTLEKASLETASRAEDRRSLPGA
jgi:hypothetical protein